MLSLMRSTFASTMIPGIMRASEKIYDFNALFSWIDLCIIGARMHDSVSVWFNLIVWRKDAPYILKAVNARIFNYFHERIKPYQSVVWPSKYKCIAWYDIKSFLEIYWCLSICVKYIPIKSHSILFMLCSVILSCVCLYFSLSYEQRMVLYQNQD